MYAVIVAGGTQHRVSEGDVLRVQKIAGAETGGTLTLSEVLVVGEGPDLRVGNPTVPNAHVTATVLGEAQGSKIRVFKKKKRKHYRRTKGHRQDFTEIRIDRIVGG